VRSNLKEESVGDPADPAVLPERPEGFEDPGEDVGSDPEGLPGIFAVSVAFPTRKKPLPSMARSRGLEV
jgi:hypothetical protein